MKLIVMTISFTALERKVDQMITLCAELRAENTSLRGHVAGLEAERTALTAKIDATRARLTALMDRLPDENAESTE